ncbi:MAG: hypothetical protein QOE69_575 [Thermoleophilaceae bacterium]|jgi:hypothetical protein|nr:hypothetical protein [Thermoleophilaceae bacterium]
MPFRIATCASVIVVLAILPAAASAASLIRPSSVTAAVAVSSGSARNVSLHCPNPAVALNGAASYRDGGLTLRRSTPGRAADDWQFRLVAAADGRTHHATLVLRCVRLGPPSAVPGARLDVKTNRPPPFSVPADGTTAVRRVRCGPGWLATGYGVHGGSSIRLASVVPVARGWNFRLENTGSHATTASVSARCLKEDVSSQRGVLHFNATRPSKQSRFGPGRSHSLTRACAAGRFGVATGSVLDPAGAFELGATGPVRDGRGRWVFRGRGEARTYLVCLSRAGSFQ